MFIKSDIRKITIALEKTYAADIYLALGKAGIIHLAPFQDRDSKSARGLEKEEALVREIVSDTDSVLHALQMEPQEAVVGETPLDQDSDAVFAAAQKKTIVRAVRLKIRLQNEARKAARQIEYDDAIRQLGADPGVIQKARLVKGVFGTLDNPVRNIPVDRPFGLTGTGNFVLGFALPKDYPALLRLLKNHGLTDLSAEVRDDSPDNLRERARNLKRRSDVIDAYINRLKAENGPALVQLNSAYRAYEDMFKAAHLALFSSRTVFITGWMDARERPRLTAILQSLCNERFIVSERKDSNPPVRLLNMKWLKPFELLVKTMGMPSPGEIDPTPLTAFTFVLMFGLMFGDLGQGLALMLGGWMLQHFGGKKKKEDLTQAGGILIACGCSAAFCGLLYGSVFSSEHILPALWFHPGAHIMKLFGVTILMGAVFIIAGLCVNILNSVLNSDYAEALLEKRGLVVLVVYIAAIVFAVVYQMTGRIPAGWAVTVFIGLPLLLFSLRGILEAALFEKEKPHNIPEYVVETFMEIVEIALGLFANTVSFIRVGAFALSHAGLSIVTYTLAGIADPAMKSAGAILIIVAGNIFIIGFEGLICGIQSMRLEYYEFFNKFFRGDGVIFSPFTLKTKSSEV